MTATQLSFVDYLLQQQKQLLDQADNANEEMRWSDADKAISDWIILLEPIQQWQACLFPRSNFK